MRRSVVCAAGSIRRLRHSNQQALANAVAEFDALRARSPRSGRSWAMPKNLSKAAAVLAGVSAVAGVGSHISRCRAPENATARVEEEQSVTTQYDTLGVGEAT